MHSEQKYPREGRRPFLFAAETSLAAICPIPHHLYHVGAVRVDEAEGRDVGAAVLKLLQVHNMHVLKHKNIQNERLVLEY
jgi:hypothetical protein